MNAFRLLLVSFLILMAGMTARSVSAAQSVDPSTLNPPVPPEFNPVCSAEGFGTLCTVAFTEIEDPGGTGIICGSGADSFEIFGGSGVRTVDGRRYYDQNNNLLERHFREVIVGTLTNPKTGAYLNTFQNDTVIHDLSVPGDVSSGVEHISGTNQFSLPKGGTVLVDTGTTVLSSADGSVLSESAHHPLDAFFTYGDASAIQPICDALMR